MQSMLLFSSRLDYWNSLHTRLNQKSIHRLQLVLQKILFISLRSQLRFTGLIFKILLITSLDQPMSQDVVWDAL